MSFANLVPRLATALVVLPLLLWAFFRPPVVGVSVIAVALAVGLFEFYWLLEAAGLVPFRWSGLLLMAAVFAEITLGVPAPVLPAALLVLLVSALRVGPASVPALSATLLAAAYLGGLGGTLAALCWFAPVADGPWRIVLLLAITMGSDTLAYFVGSALGRHKLAPSVSPGKTVEGSLGGLVGGALGALGVRALSPLPLPLVDAILLGVLAAGAGVAGDLIESLFKRWAGVKDSGALLPGHGGMLDRLDSLLFAGPVLYYYFVLSR